MNKLKLIRMQHISCSAQVIVYIITVKEDTGCVMQKA